MEPLGATATTALSTQRSMVLNDANPGTASQHALLVTDMSVTAEVVGRGEGGGGRGGRGDGGGSGGGADGDMLFRHEDNQSLLNLLFNIAEDQAKKGKGVVSHLISYSKHLFFCHKILIHDSQTNTKSLCTSFLSNVYTEEYEITITDHGA